MAEFVINGGKPLFGSVRLGGAKNASYKLMIASLLCDCVGESRLLNFSHIEDVEITRDIIKSIGGMTRNAGERTIFINSCDLTTPDIPDEFGPKSRASTMFIPILLHRFGRASVPVPGGDKIGARTLERPFEGLKAMGAVVTVKKDRVEVKASQLVGTTYKFDKNSHTGTEMMLLAAVMAQGKTTLRNAALEPEVDDLIDFLNEMGGRIRRRPGRIIEIVGVDQLHPTIYKIMPDRNEAVSYACAALVTRGDIIVENARPDHLEAFLDKLDEIQAGYEVGRYGIRFFYKGPLKAADVETQPHPGFMTDWQPLWTVLVTQAKGDSIIHETVFHNRFQHVEGLKQFGADIETYPIEVDDPEKVYNFNLDKDPISGKHAIVVHGGKSFQPTEVDVYDLRSGATFTIAALAAKGKSVLKKVELIDRGYESFAHRLQTMGADIVRKDES